ncbi:MAG: hypothetical protein F6K08_16860 [Okeania sp. SIO1H6]|nr:hypothetical protein [Okeania sp. SIO1H6]
MGIITESLGIKNNDSNSSSDGDSLSTGNHQIDHSQIIGGGVAGRFSPMNAPKFQGIQSVPVQEQARYFNKSEADALRKHRKRLAENKKATRVAYQELSRIDNYDTKVVGYHAKYAKSNARHGLRQTKKLASIARTLHSLRPGYAGINQSLVSADNSAQEQIAAIAAKIQQK